MFGDFMVPMLIFAIPIVAIVGGITAGIARTLGQQRLIELAQRERIAAIERGLDPSKLPPLPAGPAGDDLASYYLSPRQAARRRVLNLVIGGLVTLAVGVGVGFMLSVIPDARENHAWAVGLVPAFVGIALLLSALIVARTSNGDERHSPPQA